MTTNKPLANEVRALRLKHGLSTNDAAALIGCSNRAWVSWESGQRNMPISKSVSYTHLTLPTIYSV